MIGAHVMVVEDERILALHLRQQLLKLGYGVPPPVASGEHALRQIETQRPDLILMDIHIEGEIDGIETAGRIPPDYNIPVIYLTAYSEEATLERARTTRPYGYLNKPFSERELHAAIQMTLERINTEKTLREREAELRQAQKMEAIGQLAGGVAHDFNNLLGVITGNLEFLSAHTNADPLLAGMVQDALDAAACGATLTQQLLAYARRQPLEPRVLSIRRRIADMAELLRRTLGEGVQVQTQLPADLWPVCVDANQFDTALLNLALNARDAMPDGGRLTIAGYNTVLAQGSQYSANHATGFDHVMVAVTDTGVGMPQEIARRALEPFFTTKPIGQGTGLGLSMVYGFVKQSNGHIEIESQPDCGTTIKMYFPAVAAGADAPDLAANASSYPTARAGEVVMIVEDDAAVRKFVIGLIASLGYATIGAVDGIEARQLLDQGQRIDLLLTDVTLPNGLNGPVVARQARLAQPGLKVLYMSGYTGNAMVLADVGEAPVQLLTKPFRRGELARAIRRSLDGTA